MWHRRFKKEVIEHTAFEIVTDVIGRNTLQPVSKKAWGRLYNALGKAEVFVFAEQNEIPESPDYVEGTLDPPFDVMAFEMAGIKPICAAPDIITWCIVNIVEKGESHQWALLGIKNDFYVVYMGTAYSSIVASLLGRLKAEYHVTPGKAKMRQGESKSTSISNVVRIRTKHQRKDEYGERNVNWSHRFNRRGHWRRLKEGAIGKNRQGVYCEQGRTWVNDSTVGPENKPLVKKLRLVGN